MTGNVLVINAGSSSVKYQLLDPETGVVAASGLVEQIGETSGGRASHTVAGVTSERAEPIPDASAAFAVIAEQFAAHGPDLAAYPPVAVGHRVVHGGVRFRSSIVIDERVIEDLRELIPLAPLHNPANIVGIDAARVSFPDVPHVAVFDTAFHRTLPPEAYTYAVPRSWREEHGVRRYGFHGTSHEYVSGRAAQRHGGTGLGIVVLHLGNGCSACAVLDGESVETSMGLTPLEGLVMGTRSGDLDPAIAFHVIRTMRLAPDEVDTALNRQGGLLALTGDNDFRRVTERAEAGDPEAIAAIDVVVHRLVKYVGAYAAVMGRLDAIAFTGGIGEHSPLLRAAVLRRLRGLGVELDEDANASARGEATVTTATSPVAAYVIPTNEERQIAREARAVLEETGTDQSA